MTIYDDQIKREINGGEIPQKVNEKWDAVVDRIRQGEVSRKVAQKNKPLSILWKSGAAFAASFAVLVALSAANPVLAENIPFMNQLLNYFNSDRALTNPGDVITDTAVVDHIKPVVPDKTPVTGESRINGLEISEAYCDGEILVFSTKLSLEKDIPEAYNVIEPNLMIKVDGHEFVVNGDYFERMYRAEEGVYLGAVTLDVSSVELADSFSLSVEIPSIIGYDAKTQVLSQYGDIKMTDEQIREMINNMDPVDYADLSFEDKKEEFFVDGVVFSGTVSVDTSLNRHYDVNMIDGDCAVNSLETSPAYSLFDVTMPNEDYYFVVTDNMGNEVQRMELIRGDGAYYKPLYNGTTELTVNFYNEYGDDNEVLGTFKIPVETGYADVKEEIERTPVSEEEVTYIPEIPNLGEDWLARRQGATVVNLGDTLDMTQEMGAITEGNQKLTISNMQVYDSVEAAGISKDDLSFYSESLFDGKCFVTFDLKLQNQGAVALFENDAYYVNSYASNLCSKYPNKVESGSELIYFDSGEKGKSYFKFTLDADGEKTMKVGFLGDRDALERGDYQFDYSGYDENGKTNAYMDIPAYKK